MACKRDGSLIFRALFFLLLLVPEVALSADSTELIDFTRHWAGFLCLGIFFVAYSLVILEEKIHLRKSKPVIVAAGFIWIIVAFVYAQSGDTHTAEVAVRHNLLEFAELFLFLLAAMTYINTMDDRGIFNLLRSWLLSKEFSLRMIFCLTGAISFLLSPIADNLTTALLMSTVVMAVGGTNVKFVSIACINIVVAANAGGAFSPFGDITTLMVWQKGGLVEFTEFFHLVLPSLVNWLIPASIMFFFISSETPDPIEEKVVLRDGAWVIVGLFIVTITLAVSVHSFLHLPPVVGMMTGLGLLKLFAYYLQLKHHLPVDEGAVALGAEAIHDDEEEAKQQSFNVFTKLAHAEWDTLMFFYGVILCVGGLGTLGYLELVSTLMYGDLGVTNANILVGFLSALIDNIPVMFAVLEMMPDMELGQWLLVTLTAGVGGSMLSIGSAAGVAVMGQARGVYTFMAHLKWSWAIFLGYAASIWVHFLVNGRFFN
ncbi:MAG: sodium:proton antiporter NhaD [Gammaproteobacteria bacterium]|jgi:Na+/H+ antiporter NhaD/arsenite permease-like protein|nr:sodium:proton antiporter NhaD [Gammaproteobacteria bacterium]